MEKGREGHTCPCQVHFEFSIVGEERRYTTSSGEYTPSLYNNNPPFFHRIVNLKVSSEVLGGVSGREELEMLNSAV